MTYQHDIAGCLARTLGQHGLSDQAFAHALKRAEPALAGLRARHADRGLPLLRLPEATDDIAGLAALAEHARRNFQDVIVLGTGGSSLGGQTLTALTAEPLPAPTHPRLHFVDNIDPHGFDRLLGGLDPARSLFLVISKSGGTAETLAQFLIALDVVRKRLGQAGPGDHFVVITEPGDNVLRRLAGQWRLRVLDHDPGIGGRFSVLSLVAMLPAMIAGIDGLAVRAGAAQVLKATLDAPGPAQSEPARGAAVSIGLAEERGLNISVIMPYCDRLGPFGFWYRQLWAESLGKSGRGTTPVRALGAVDQHSQLQLYLDGPRDKMFTLVTLDQAGLGGRIEPDLATDAKLDYLSGRRLGDLFEAEQNATAQTLLRAGRPTRRFHLASLDERALGALLMHFMLETIIAAELLGVDPFDQPAVEAGKVLARDTLAAKVPA